MEIGYLTVLYVGLGAKIGDLHAKDSHSFCNRLIVGQSKFRLLHGLCGATLNLRLVPGHPFFVCQKSQNRDSLRSELLIEAT